MVKKISEMFDLKGKLAVITGASEWLGYDMACALAGYGCDIIITSRNLDRAYRACEKINSEFGVDTQALELDQRKFESVSEFAQKAMQFKGHIDILINNAGGGSGNSQGNLFERDPADIIEMIETNLTGCIFCCREFGKYMMAQGYGKIINIASIAGIVGRDRRMYRSTNKMEQSVDYAAAKSGIIGFTRDLAGLMSPHGICVNSISPGGFDKGDLPEEFVKKYSESTILGRMGRMGDDIMGAALFLASSASDYITGHNLVVDGGFSIWK
ncbi:MAG: SDR family NAD(P)-dependent oxidoreductase [Candidatus Humimicrobiaceae bacterium]